MSLPVTASGYYGQELLKIVYGMAQRTVQACPTIQRALSAYGGVQPYTAGGKNFTFLLRGGFAGGSGFQTTTNDISHIGETDPNDQQVSVSYTLRTVRSQTTAMEIAAWEAGGNNGQFYNRWSEGLSDRFVQNEQCIDAILSSTQGDGRYTTVTATTAAIAAAASGTVTVAATQQLVQGTILVVNRSGSDISDVILQVYSPNGTPGYGAGTVTVKNVGGTSYTPTTDDILFEKGHEICFMASILESIGTAAYPPRGPNTTAITRADYVSLVEDAGSTKMSYAKLRAMWDRLYQTAQTIDDVNAQKGADGKWYHTNVVWLPVEQRTQILQEIVNQRRFNETINRVDPGWGDVAYVDGIPLATTVRCPANTAFLFDTTGWIGRIDGFDMPTLTSDGNVYRPIPQTNKYESVANMLIGFYCANRKTQARIDNVTGFTLSDADLS